MFRLFLHFANSLMNKYICSFTINKHILFTNTISERRSPTHLYTLRYFSPTNQQKFSSNLEHLLVCFLIKGSLFCFSAVIDQQCHLLLILPLQYHIWWIDWQPTARDQFVREHWTLSKKTNMPQSWMAYFPRGCLAERVWWRWLFTVGLWGPGMCKSEFVSWFPRE